MMEFLQRLAPPRNADRSRAVPVLPPCFARETPLGAAGIERAAALRDDLALSNPPDAGAPDRAAVPETGRDEDEASPRAGVAPGVSDRTARPRETATPQASLSAELRARAIRAAGAPAGVADRAQDAPRLRDAAARAVVVASKPAHVTLPLSQRLLVQQGVRTRDEARSIHVTIGRIEVIATSAPAPVERRAPAPRQPSIALADYLQSGKDGR
jgi:hypothetical protein